MGSPDAVNGVPAQLLDRESLDLNLEGERAKGLTCPCCQKVNEWTLGPKTKTEILDTVSRPGVDGIHEKLIRCKDAACPPFLRRITAGQDGAFKVETISLEQALVDLRYARALAQAADSNARETEARRRELEGIRDDLRRQLEAAHGETEEAARLRRDASDLDSWLRTAFSKLGFSDTNDREGFVKALDAAFAKAQMLDEIARLGNRTPEELLKIAEEFAARHGRK